MHTIRQFYSGNPNLIGLATTVDLSRHGVRSQSNATRAPGHAETRFPVTVLLTMFDVLADALRFIMACLRARCALAAENLFRREQLALYLERKVKPRRARPATKLTLVLLSTLLAWREALTVVQPDTFIRWHRKGFRLFWSRKSNALCERLVGTIRRECLDFLIPLNERQLRRFLQEWVAHYNKGRPYSSLGPEIPEPTAGGAVTPLSGYGIPSDHRVLAEPILGGLQLEFRLEGVAA